MTDSTDGEIRTSRVAPLIFASGACALVYQIAWQRELRLIFGASTAASAAVLAIFIGGLGIGGLLLGARADRHPRPLAFYAQLEALIAVTTALTPLLLWLVRLVYLKLGGSVALGLGAGTLLRLVLGALVLAVPTLLMGGTLPAAARAVERDDDTRRRNVALLYAANTLGAVTGCVLATFFLLEIAGTRRTLWIACLCNVLIALAARQLARRGAPISTTSSAPATDATTLSPPAAQVRFAVVAAAVVGLAFFLMELVWYRLLGPLLGGTVFTFGLILAVALLGIGVGGFCYSLFGKDRPATLAGLALTCLIEAALVAVGLALGDRLALLAVVLRSLGGLGFGGFILGWAAITAIVVFPVAVVAGVQFPLLIGLFGAGRHQVGRQVGLAYAWNTVGAIGGSLAGGFGLLPALGAVGCWRLVAGLLAALGLAAAGLATWQRRAPRALVVPLLLAAAVVLLVRSDGPTAAWRHSQIGVGYVHEEILSSTNRVRDWINGERRAIRWEGDGVESSVAVGARASSTYFVINGKVDGNARSDAPTQVMVGLLGAILHPDPRRAMVIGLGTGSSAGWLGAVPSMERVDVVELEPQVLEVARACGPVNRDVMTNPKVKITVGDAREVLLTARDRYDVVASEPSNPYRAGIASLFTREYYQAISDRLTDDGVLLQWVQAYEIDGQTIRSIYATLHSVFPYVETWQLHPQDMVLVASRRPHPISATRMREKLRQEPYRSGLLQAWNGDSLEALLAHHVAGPRLADGVARLEGDYLNTDDLAYVEFGFARAIGQSGLHGVYDLHEVARLRGEDRPEVVDGEVSWPEVLDARQATYVAEGLKPAPENGLSPRERAIAGAFERYAIGDLTGALPRWRALGKEPGAPVELCLVAESLADLGDEAALPYIERVRAFSPASADACLGRLRLRQGRLPEAAAALEASLVALRQDPWPMVALATRALNLAVDVATRDRTLAPRLLAALETPFSVEGLHDRRLLSVIKVAELIGPVEIARASRAFEPHVPWQAKHLSLRAKAYADTHDPAAARAAADFDEFLRHESVPFSIGLVP